MSSSTNLFSRLRNSPIAKTATVYLVSAWVGLQVLDIISGIFGISILFQQWAFLLLVLCLPITLLFVYAYQQRAGSGQAKLFSWLISLFIIGVGVFSGYQTLGFSMTETFEITLADGTKESREVVKEKYVKSVMLFPLENKSDSAQAHWVGQALAKYTEEHLS